jgi:predicted GH43/DUF377 family glycosyl hydrolase
MNSSVFIYSGNSSDWDEYIREIGNLFYNPNKDKYFFFYSAHNEEYKENNVFVGMAYSNDGITWEKYGKVTNFSAEDPYVVLKDNIFYMFYEDKGEVPFRRINLAISEDATHWILLKKGILNPSPIGWQSQDVSSPIVIFNGEEWIMLYEGRSLFNHGEIGFATSKDLINWKKKSFPVFSGGNYWDNFAVPDDIFRYGDYYIMSYHGYNKRTGWQEGLLESTDLKNWKIFSQNPISNSDTIMFLRKDSGIGFIEENDNKINVNISYLNFSSIFGSI